MPRGSKTPLAPPARGAPPPTSHGTAGAARTAPAAAAAAAGAIPPRLAEGESAITYKSPLNVLKDTYDYSCY
jgi:hypothetical protein